LSDANFGLAVHIGDQFASADDAQVGTVPSVQPRPPPKLLPVMAPTHGGRAARRAGPRAGRSPARKPGYGHPPADALPPAQTPTEHAGLAFGWATV